MSWAFNFSMWPRARSASSGTRRRIPSSVAPSSESSRRHLERLANGTGTADDVQAIGDIMGRTATSVEQSIDNLGLYRDALREKIGMGAASLLDTIIYGPVGKRRLRHVLYEPCGMKTRASRWRAASFALRLSRATAMSVQTPTTSRPRPMNSRSAFTRSVRDAGIMTSLVCPVFSSGKSPSSLIDEGHYHTTGSPTSADGERSGRSKASLGIAPKEPAPRMYSRLAWQPLPPHSHLTSVLPSPLSRAIMRACPDTDRTKP
jgi:hypothetical protein